MLKKQVFTWGKKNEQQNITSALSSQHTSVCCSNETSAYQLEQVAKHTVASMRCSHGLYNLKPVNLKHRVNSSIRKTRLGLLKNAAGRGSQLGGTVSVTCSRSKKKKKKGKARKKKKQRGNICCLGAPVFLVTVTTALLDHHHYMMLQIWLWNDCWSARTPSFTSTYGFPVPLYA